MSDQSSTWITENDLVLLINLADMAQELVANLRIAFAGPIAQALRASDDVEALVAEIEPLLQQNEQRFPQPPVDQPIPYTMSETYDWTDGAQNPYLLASDEIARSMALNNLR